MVPVWKYFLFFCFAVFFLSGCGKVPSNQAQVAAAAPTKTQAKENKDDGKIDLSKLTPEEQTKANNIAKDVKALIKMSKRADQVFNEAWGAYWEDFSQKPYTVFRAVKNALESSYAEDGIELAPSAASKAQRATLKFAGSTYTLTQASGKIAAMIQVQQDAQGRTYYKIKYAREAKWIGQLFELFGSVSVNTAEKDQSKAYTFKRTFVECALYPDASFGLAEMTCANIGHDRSLDSYVVFTKLSFVANKDVSGLEVNGYKIQNGDLGPKPVVSFEIKDNLKENVLEIKEKEMGSQESGTERKVEKPAPPTVSEEEAEKNADKAVSEAVKAAQSALEKTAEPAATAKVVPAAGERKQENIVGDQGVDPSQIDAVTGEIVPLEDVQIDTPPTEANEPGQGIPTVR